MYYLHLRASYIDGGATTHLQNAIPMAWKRAEEYALVLLSIPGAICVEFVKAA